MEEKLQYKLSNYEKALQRLKEATDLPTDESIVIDGIIKRFEFTYESSWKLMKAYLEHLGIVDVKSPRMVFKEAFTNGVIEDAKEWLSMINDRNATSHTYDEGLALEICERVKNEYLSIFQKFLYDLKIKVDQ